MRPVRSVRYLTGIAQSDTPEAGTAKQDCAKLSVFVYYDINETRSAKVIPHILHFVRGLFSMTNKGGSALREVYHTSIMPYYRGIYHIFQHMTRIYYVLRLRNV